MRFICVGIEESILTNGGSLADKTYGFTVFLLFRVNLLEHFIHVELDVALKVIHSLLLEVVLDLIKQS